MEKIVFEDPERKRKIKIIVETLVIIFIIAAGGACYYLFFHPAGKPYGLKLKSMYVTVSGIFLLYPVRIAMPAILLIMGGVIIYLWCSNRVNKRKMRFAGKNIEQRLIDKEKELDSKLERAKKEFTEHSVKMSSSLLKVRELLSTLDKEKIFKIVIDMLYHGVGSRETSIYLLERGNNELFLVESSANRQKGETIKITGEHFPGWVARNGLFISESDARRKPALAGLIGKGPVPSKMCAPLVVEGRVVGIINVEKYVAGKENITDEEKKLVNTISFLTGMAIKNADIFTLTREELISSQRIKEEVLKAKKTLNRLFERYTSPEVVKELLEHPERCKLGGEKRIATVFFSDIAGFTTISESMPPEKLVPFLNEYLSVMTDIILDEGAYLDKYEGDAIMAVFGVPVDRGGDHAVRACRAALANRKALPQLWKKWEERGLPKIDIRVGLNTGPMIVGNMGSERRLDYTVIGDTVNLASRLEGANKVFGTHIMIGPGTKEMVGNNFETRKLAILQVKGKDKPAEVFELIAERGEISESLKDVIGTFEQGLDLYLKREWDQAYKLFEKANSINGPDPPSEYYMKQCRQFISHEPGDDWTGVIKLLTK